MGQRGKGRRENLESSTWTTTTAVQSRGATANLGLFFQGDAEALWLHACQWAYQAMLAPHSTLSSTSALAADPDRSNPPVGRELFDGDSGQAATHSPSPVPGHAACMLLKTFCGGLRPHMAPVHVCAGIGGTHCPSRHRRQPSAAGVGTRCRPCTVVAVAASGGARSTALRQHALPGYRPSSRAMQMVQVRNGHTTKAT